jgi:DNA-directed RNA polymerase subunit RPC12/RpoP
MTVAAQTAEWICARCGATNRKLVSVRTTQTLDRCVTCHTRHVVELDSRPVRWNARLKDGKDSLLP